jgi:hypothetical protein
VHGARNLHQAAVRQLLHHALGHVAVEDRAVLAAQDERRRL